MTPDPIEGLKVGLEIHQQLGRPGDTKLFCRCPAEMVEREPDLVVRRRLRASAGETGEVDVAAKTEAAKAKESLYHAYRDATCLVELDEEPPRPANADAIATAVMVAKACKSIILPRMQFMRKTIVDGSATSGFQRTGLLAFGGTVPGLQKPVRVQTVCVEEDAAKLVSRAHDLDIYDLSRLGIPLIELATEPDINTPEQAQEVAAQIGMLLRSTRRVKRGLGTIRQDLNVSVPRGTRVELKGCQDLRMIPTIIRNEATRQNGLADVAEHLRTARVSEQQLTASVPADVTEHARHATAGFLKKAFAKGDRAIGLRVPGMHGVLGRGLCPDYRVGSELADLARTAGFGGLIHSDEDLAKYGLAQQAVDIRKLLGCGADDAFLILVGDPDRGARIITQLLKPRLVQLLKGVPAEVRKINADGTTAHLRPMPGGARMYPETDVPLVEIDLEVPALKLLTEQVAELKGKTGLSEDQVKAILSDDIPILEYMARFPTLQASFLASSLLDWPQEISSKTGVELPDPVTIVEPLLPLIASRQIPGSALKSVYEDIGTAIKAGKPYDVIALAQAYSQMPDEELRAIVDEAIAAAPDASPNGLMGRIMAKARGKADGQRIMAMLRERKGG